MPPRVLILIDSDPCRDGRAAEAVRIAAGMGAWHKLELTVYLHGPAVRLLGMDNQDLPDGDHYHEYLPVLREMGHQLRVDADAQLPRDLAEEARAFSPLDAAGLARLAATCSHVLRF